MIKYWIVLLLFTFWMSACEKKPQDSLSSGSSVNSSSSASASLSDRGRAVYQTNCTACHNPDPHKTGSIGPEVAGSSRALLEARILRADYPPDYLAKRMTHVMSALPHLKGEIDALHAYLNSK